jgi:hypothetical protein
MFNCTKLAKKPKLFLSVTGLTVPQFDSLSKEIQKQYKTTEVKRLSKNKRQREIGAGHKFNHSIKDRVLMFLMYYRMYTTYDMLGMIFDLDKSNIMRDIRYLEPAVKQSIPIPTKKYADSKKLKSLEDIQQFFPKLVAITDGTEQSIPRPKNRTKRKTHYSGKKKKHTVKNQITINLKGEIIHKSSHAPGSHHDYKIYKSKHPVLSGELLQFYDLGYLGIQKDFPKQTSILPYKKKRGEKLSGWQKEWNNSQSKIRIKVEHVIAQIKKFRINRDVFRNRLCRYDMVSDIVCGIVNFKIRWKEEFITIP